MPSLLTGCDSIWTLTVNANPVLTFSDDTTLCANELPYTFHGHVFTVAQTLTDTVPSLLTGCDSITVLHLTVKDTVLRHIHDVVCLNTAYTEYGFNVTAEQTATPGEMEPIQHSDEGANHCDSTTVLHLTVLPAPPTPTLTPADNTSCTSVNGSITVTNPIGDEYMYALNNGTQQSNNTFTELTGGTYTITVTNTNNGCSSSDTVRINNTNSSINVTALANAPCENDTLKLTSTAVPTEGVTFKWINTNGDTLFYVQNPIIPNVTTDNAGTYTVIATETETGCIANNSVTVTVKVLPTASISGDTVICQGETETLTANSGSGYSYLWNTGETSQSIEVNSANTYTVTVTNANNCSKADTFSLSVRDSVSITTTPISVCPDEDGVTVSATFLNATENYSVTWTANNSGNTHEISSPQQTDFYDITIPNNLCDDSLYYNVQYSDGICTASKTDFVHVVDTVKPIITDTLPEITAPGCSTEDAPCAYSTISEIINSGYLSISDNCTSPENLTLSHQDQPIPESVICAETPPTSPKPSLSTDFPYSLSVKWIP